MRGALATLVGFLTVVVAGCSDDRPAPVTDAAANSDASQWSPDAGLLGETGTGGAADGALANPAVPGGTLRIEVTGLPKDTGAILIVTGPNDYSKRLLAAADLIVEPGDYAVEAYAVSADRTGYVPDVDAHPVTVSASAGALVRFTYAPLEAKVRDNARVLDAETAAGVMSVVTIVQRGVLTFRAMTPQLAGLKIGDVVVLGQTTATPHGFFGRVTEISGLVVQTDAASIEDVLEDGVLSFSRSFDVNDIESVTPIDNGIPFDLRICNALTASLPASRGVAGVALRVTGELCFTPSASMSLRLLPFRFSFDVGAGLSVAVNAEAIASLSLGIEVPILTIALTSFTIWTGPVPWVITPEFSIIVGATGEIKVGVTTGVRAGAWAAGGFTYEKKRFTTRSSSGSSFEFAWPEPIAEAELKAYAGPRLTFLVNGAGGPTLGIDGYARFYVNFLPSVTWDLYAGIDFKAGFATSKLLNLSWETSLYKYEKLLASSKSPPTPSSQLSNRPEFRTSQGPALGKDGSIILPRDGELVSITEGGMRRWTFKTGQYMMEPTVGPDGTVYAGSFEGVVYAVDGTTGNKRWDFDTQRVGFPQLALGPWLYGTLDAEVIALDPTTGMEKWRFPMGSRANGLAINKDGTVLYATGGGNTISALNAMTGAPSWAKTLPGDLYSGTGSTPTIGRDGTIYVAVYPHGGAWGVHVARVRPDGTMLPTRPVSAYGEESTSVTVGPDGSLYLCNLNVAAGLLSNGGVWRVNMQAGYNCDGAPALDAAGNLFLTDAINMYAINSRTGQIIWKKPMGRSGGVSASPLILPNGHVVMPNEEALWIFAGGSDSAAATWARGGGDRANTRRAP